VARGRSDAVPTDRAPPRDGPARQGVGGRARLPVMATPVTVNEVLDGQVALDLRCLDRIYLNAYVPNLQVGGQVVSFFDRALEPSTMQPATRSRAAEERLAGLQAARNMGLPPGSWAASLLVHLTRPRHQPHQKDDATGDEHDGSQRRPRGQTFRQSRPRCTSNGRGARATGPRGRPRTGPCPRNRTDSGRTASR
jgi:hypothetical protein